MQLEKKARFEICLLRNAGESVRAAKDGFLLRDGSFPAKLSRRTCASTGRSKVTLGAYRVYTVSAAYTLECLFYGDWGITRV